MAKASTRTAKRTQLAKTPRKPKSPQVPYPARKRLRATAYCAGELAKRLRRCVPIEGAELPQYKLTEYLFVSQSAEIREALEWQERLLNPHRLPFGPDRGVKIVSGWAAPVRTALDHIEEIQDHLLERYGFEYLCDWTFSKPRRKGAKMKTVDWSIPLSPTVPERLELAARLLTECTGGLATAPAEDGEPFWKPKHFTQWDIGDELLRRNCHSGEEWVKGKVRRRPLPNSKAGKHARREYSEPDARKVWPERFAVGEGQAQKA